MYRYSQFSVYLIVTGLDLKFTFLENRRPEPPLTN